MFLERVNEAQRLATRDIRDQMRDKGNGKKHGKKRSRDDAGLQDDGDDDR